MDRMTLDAVAVRRPTLLALAYSPTVDSDALHAMEVHARRLGLPLATIERLGQDRDLCEAFARAADRGEAAALLRALDAGALAARAAPARPRDA